MTKRKIVEILKGMDCEIAKVKLSFRTKYHIYVQDVLVYLVPEPSNDDQIINANHLFIFSDVKEFDENIAELNKYIKYGSITQIDFLGVSEFISDFKKEIDPVNDAIIEPNDEEKTIQWYKVKCSFFKEEFGVRLWKDLIDFMSHTIGFDYTITGQYTKPYTGVEGYYENGKIIKL